MYLDHGCKRLGEIRNRWTDHMYIVAAFIH